MDSIVTKKTFKDALDKKISREEAEEAVKTLIKWVGDNPNREGLKDTPKRVIKAYEEFFSGYKESAEKFLSKTFEDVQGYEDLVMLKDINFNSHCEHHMVPIEGKVHLAYIPIFTFSNSFYKNVCLIDHIVWKLPIKGRSSVIGFSIVIVIIK